MKKFIALIIFLNTFSIIHSQEYFYYYNGEKHPLELNTNYLFVSSLGEDPMRDISKMDQIVSVYIQKEVTSPKLKYVSGSKEDFYWGEIKIGSNLSKEEYDTVLEKIKKMNGVYVVSPYFKSKDSKKLGLSNFFYV